MQKPNLIKPILLIGGAFLLITALKASNFISNLRIYFTNLSLGGSLLNPKVFATLRIYNPTNNEVTISDLRGVLLYKNNFFANVQTVKEENIKAFSNVYFDLELSSTLPDMISVIKQFTTNKISNDFYFDGTLKVNGVMIPYKGKLQS